jgi:hypothetical protein
MPHRRNEYFERLQDHLIEREWSEEQILNLAHRIGHSALMSHEGVLEVLEYQQEVDEGIQAKKEYDRVFINDTRVDL